MATPLAQLCPTRDWDVVLRYGLPATRLLRLSLTDRCNFRCRYCMPAAGVPLVQHSELLSLEALADTVEWLSRHLGIERVKLTGGEPLVRRGLESFIAALSALPSVREVSLTTNGSLLAGRARELKAAGLARVNVSLDSLDADRFAQISRGGRLADTLAGIEAALDAGLVPLKLNVVLRRSTWKQDVPMLLDFAAERGLEPRFIELMRTGTERDWCESEFVPVTEVWKWLEARTTLVALRTPVSTPGKQTKMQWGSTPLVVGWIAPRSHPFCSRCERIRLDSRGRLRRCLMDPTTLDVWHLRHASEPDAVDHLYRYLAGKHAPKLMDSECAMSQIGG